jgi:hypothetical protein
MFKYNYSIANDFSNGCNVNCLHKEISASSISTLFDGLFNQGDNLDVMFNSELSGEDETTLNDIIDNHDASIECIESNSEYVTSTGEQPGDGYTLKYDTTAMVWVATPDIHDLEFITEEYEEHQTSTTSTDWEQKLRMSVSDLTEGTYKIDWYYEWTHAHSSYEFMARVQINNSNTIMEHNERPRSPGNFYRYSYPCSGFKIISLNAGDYNIDLDFRSSRRNKAAYLRRSRLAIWRIN